MMERMGEEETFDDQPLAEFDPQMTEETFSFFDVLTERTYPQDVVHIYMDEKAAYDFDRLSREIDTTIEPDEETISRWSEEAQTLQKRIQDSKYTLYLTGVSDDSIEECQTKANDHFANKKKQRKVADGSIQKYLPEDEQLNYLRYFNAVVNSIHIERIFRHKDERWMVAPIDPDEIAHLYDKAPASEKAKINTAIQSLRVKSEAYERDLDEGFLAKP